MQPNTEAASGRKFQIREMLGGWESKAPTGAFAADRFVSARRRTTNSEDCGFQRC
jgi:hypothetical protein